MTLLHEHDIRKMVRKNLIRQRSESLPMGTVRINGHPIQVEIAATEDDRAMGLMFREGLPDGHGMLFLYEEPRQLSFWMKNTVIPLSLAYINKRGEIVQFEDMQPGTLAEHCSVAPVPHALEVRQGWFRENDIQVGDLVDFGSLYDTYP